MKHGSSDLPELSKAPFLIEGQHWKLWLFACLLAVSGVCFYATDLIASVFGMSSVLVVLTAVAISLLAIIGSALFVRCPACSLSIAWYALSKQPYDAWLSWLVETKVCPQCGFSHTTDQSILDE